MAGIKPIPFKIDRNLMVNFAEQMAEGFRAAIRRGYYRSGEILPKQSEIAAALGVSIRIPREAYRILERDSYVRSRRGIGCEVVGRQEGVWKGRVLLAYQSESEGSYSRSVFLGSVRRRLTEAGYLVTLGGIDHSPSGKPDFAPLISMLHTPHDIVVAFYLRRRCERLLAGCGMPVVYEDELSNESSRPGIWDDALDAVSSRCRELGVRRVLLAGYWPVPAVEELLTRDGFEVETMLMKGNPGPNYIERLIERSVRAFCSRFGRRADRPDLVLCIDDYVARGALAAFAHLGIRMPDDVRFVTLTNRGNAPASAVRLARLENDPRANGAWAADALLARLNGGDHAALPPQPTLHFLDGETFSGAR